MWQAKAPSEPSVPVRPPKEARDGAVKGHDTVMLDFPKVLILASALAACFGTLLGPGPQGWVVKGHLTVHSTALVNCPVCPLAAMTADVQSVACLVTRLTRNSSLSKMD